MNAHTLDIAEFLSKSQTIFVVPVYQRNYDWKNDSCNQLFKDIADVAELGKEHFLGTLCIKSSSSHYELSIIDGQQRLTSISLLMKAIYDLDNDEDTRETIRDYLRNKGRGITADLKTKLHLNDRDDAVYHILLDKAPSERECLLTSTQMNSRIYQNYRLFCDRLNEYSANGGNLGDLVDALKLLTVVELEIQNENPQEIFESLNSTGLNLTNVDLLRNYFLMQFDRIYSVFRHLPQKNCP